MYDYNLQLSNLEKDIQAFMSSTYDNASEELINNKQLKSSLKELIERVFLDNDIPEGQKNTIINRSLMILAKSTGCAEDLEIAESVLDDLFERKIIHEIELNVFYEHASTARWE